MREVGSLTLYKGGAQAWGLRSPNIFDTMRGTMMRALKVGISKEEKVANAMGKLLSDFSLDLESVGRYLALSQPYTIYARAVEVLEATHYNKTVAEYREIGQFYGNNTLF